jgi:DinB superfamily
MTDERPWADVQTLPCEECGFDPATVDRAGLPAAVEGLGRRYRAPLTRFLPGEDSAALVRKRPAPDTWSALEYACHVRDALAVFDGRIQQALVEDNPELGWWDHEAAVIDEAYNEQDPTEVAESVAANSSHLAAALAGVPDAGWDRPATRRGIEPFTVAGMGRYALHEGLHHLLDVGRALRAARGR